jgi:DNA-binding transcriptional regulator GbsR (MarR family)
MKVEEAKRQFIAAWGSFGSNWGVNRTMAQIHALLLVSSRPLSADEVMQDLNISRGNANMNLRELINWGLVERSLISGQRKEYFLAEKDIWKVAKTIARERKKRELEPMLRFLESLKLSEQEPLDADGQAFVDAIHGIKKFGHQAEQTIDGLIRVEENWFVGTLLKMLK